MNNTGTIAVNDTVAAQPYRVTIPTGMSIGTGANVTSFALSGGPITCIPASPNLSLEFPVVTSGTMTAYNSTAASATLNTTGLVLAGTRGITTSGITGTANPLNINSVAGQPINIQARGNGLLTLGGGSATDSIKLQANSGDVATVKSTGIEMASGLGITTSGITGGAGALNINSVSDQPINIRPPGTGALTLSGGNTTNSISLQANGTSVATVKSTGIEMASGLGITTSSIKDSGNTSRIKLDTTNGVILNLPTVTPTLASLADGEAVISASNANTLLLSYRSGGTLRSANLRVDSTAGYDVMPAGSIMTYAGSSAPTGWLLCNGASVSRSTYANLFSVIGTLYGNVDGSTFNVPDMRNRTQRTVGSTFTLGQVGGADTVTITADNLPQHSHGINNAIRAAAQIGYGSNGNYYSDTNNTIISTTSDQTYLNGTTTVTGNSAVNTLNKYIALNSIIKY
jgi:microcystin-dependent protein